MKAVVWHGIGDIRLDEVPEPTIQTQDDAIVRLTASAICGTDLHFVRGTMSGMKPVRSWVMKAWGWSSNLVRWCATLIPATGW